LIGSRKRTPPEEVDVVGQADVGVLIADHDDRTR